MADLFTWFTNVLRHRTMSSIYLGKGRSNECYLPAPDLAKPGVTHEHKEEKS